MFALFLFDFCPGEGGTWSEFVGSVAPFGIRVVDTITGKLDMVTNGDSLRGRIATCMLVLLLTMMLLL